MLAFSGWKKSSSVVVEMCLIYTAIVLSRVTFCWEVDNHQPNSLNSYERASNASLRNKLTRAGAGCHAKRTHTAACFNHKSHNCLDSAQFIVAVGKSLSKIIATNLKLLHENTRSLHSEAQVANNRTK